MVKENKQTTEDYFDTIVSENTGERANARKFKNVYVAVRKSLVKLAKERKDKGSEYAVNEAKIILNKALELLN